MTSLLAASPISSIVAGAAAGGKPMKKIALAVAVCLLSSVSAFATCNSVAADKKLAGAALNTFMGKCEREASTICEAESKHKKLTGAAKASHMTKCVADAIGYETLICLRPVFIEEMRLRDQIDGNGETTISVAEAINFLNAKYCRVVAEILEHDDSVQVKENCFQYTGMFRGERDFWGTCHGQRTPERSDRSPRKEELQRLVACCMAYCRAIRCNSPPLPRACDPERLASADYYAKRYFFDGARLGLGITVPACR